MVDDIPKPRWSKFFFIWLAVAVACRAVSVNFPDFLRLASGWTALDEVGMVAALLAVSNLLSATTLWWLLRRKKPASEALMVSRMYTLVAVAGIFMVIAYAFGKLGAFGNVLAIFGGMFLGWSLQAPVSGFAAWVLVSLKRPFRPGDRIQFPSLGLVGDVKDIGAMYTLLDQVGGTIGSEEAVGRFILVPNAMLFNQVVINYTVKQEAAFMLDEVVIRITYDSNWDRAEQILRDAAVAVTKDIVEASGVQPYVRSDWYDYGVYLRLRYQTRVKDRVEIAYEIQKRIFEGIQRTPTVDMAIPYVYSYRASMDRKDDDVARNSRAPGVIDIPVDRIDALPSQATPQDVQTLAERISRQGLLQPIVVRAKPEGDGYELLAGHLRLEACRTLGWQTIPALVRQQQSVGTAQP